MICPRLEWEGLEVMVHYRLYLRPSDLVLETNDNDMLTFLKRYTCAINAPGRLEKSRVLMKKLDQIVGI